MLWVREMVLAVRSEVAVNFFELSERAWSVAVWQRVRQMSGNNIYTTCEKF